MLQGRTTPLDTIAAWLAGQGAEVTASSLCRHRRALLPPGTQAAKTLDEMAEEAISTRAILRRIIAAGEASIAEKGEKVDASVLLRAMAELRELEGEEIQIQGPWLRICEAAEKLDRLGIHTLEDLKSLEDRPPL
jgi:hypothetical protein